jgi:hypothetical protein
MSVLHSETPPTAPPSLRLLAPPVSEPPYDDELTTRPVMRLVPTTPLVPAHPLGVGAARRAVPARRRTLPGVLPGSVVALPALQRPLRLVPEEPAARCADADADGTGLVTCGDGAAPDRLTPAAELPAPRSFAHALVQRLLEVLAGVRPVTQLRRHTTLELYERVERLVHARPRATGLRPGARAVRSVHVQVRPEGVVEVCATVQRGPRTGALALRLEGRAGAWCCTELAGL